MSHWSIKPLKVLPMKQNSIVVTLLTSCKKVKECCELQWRRWHKQIDDHRCGPYPIIEVCVRSKVGLKHGGKIWKLPIMKAQAQAVSFLSIWATVYPAMTKTYSWNIPVPLNWKQKIGLICISQPINFVGRPTQASFYWDVPILTICSPVEL